jgi:hypothetical protein
MGTLGEDIPNMGTSASGGSRRRRRRGSTKSKSRGNGLKRGLKGTKRLLKRARKLNRSLLKLVSPKRMYN